MGTDRWFRTAAGLILPRRSFAAHKPYPCCCGGITDCLDCVTSGQYMDVWWTGVADDQCDQCNEEWNALHFTVEQLSAGSCYFDDISGSTWSCGSGTYFAQAAFSIDSGKCRLSTWACIVRPGADPGFESHYFQSGLFSPGAFTDLQLSYVGRSGGVPEFECDFTAATGHATYPAP